MKAPSIAQLGAIVLGLAAFPALGFVACSDNGQPATPKVGLMLAFRSDMAIPKDIGVLHLDVSEEGVQRFANDFHLGGPPDAPLPATFALLPPHDATIPIKIRIVALKNDGTPVVMRQIVTTIPDDRVALLPIDLAWLCWNSVKNASTDPTSPDFQNTTCNADSTCVAGTCADQVVNSKKLPKYDAALVFGGASGPGPAGTCFDTIACFSSATAASVTTSDCSLDAPANPNQFNVALMLPPGNPHGICGSNGCVVPLERDDTEGWHLDSASGRAMLPKAVCDKLGSEIAAVAISDKCSTKTFSIPTCGPWSSVSGTAGNFDASLPSFDASVDSAMDSPADVVIEPPPADPHLGLPCVSPSDCGTLDCKNADSIGWSGEGPAHGVCTIDCSAWPSGYCAAIEPGAVCVPGGGTSYCYEGCAPGASDGGFDPTKCRGRSDMACAPLTFAGKLTPACIPSCNSDADCSDATANTFCNPGTGFCGPVKPSGLSYGSTCGDTGDAGTCQAACLDVFDPSTGNVAAQVCGGPCTVGAPGACGQLGTPPFQAACLKNGVPNSSDTGDFGVCTELCDCQTPCGDPSMVCALNEDPISQQTWLYPGYCTLPVSADGGAVNLLGC